MSTGLTEMISSGITSSQLRTVASCLAWLIAVTARSTRSAAC
jgi:hypothetical protein